MLEGEGGGAMKTEVGNEASRLPGRAKRGTGAGERRRRRRRRSAKRGQNRGGGGSHSQGSVCRLLTNPAVAFRASRMVAFSSFSTTTLSPPPTADELLAAELPTALAPACPPCPSLLSVLPPHLSGIHRP